MQPQCRGNALRGHKPRWEEGALPGSLPLAPVSTLPPLLTRDQIWRCYLGGYSPRDFELGEGLAAQTVGNTLLCSPTVWEGVSIKPEKQVINN